MREAGDCGLLVGTRATRLKSPGFHWCGWRPQAPWWTAVAPSLDTIRLSLTLHHPESP